MDITITRPAVKWMKEELNVESGDSVRFYVRYGGSPQLYPGFSMGIALDKPERPAVKTEEEGLTFFVEDADSWYLRAHNLHVSFSRKHNTIIFEYNESSDAE